MRPSAAHSGDSSTQSPEVSWDDGTGGEVEQEQIRGAATPVGGPVGGEDQPAAVGAGARVEVLVAVGR